MADRIVAGMAEQSPLQLEIVYRWVFDAGDAKHLNCASFNVPDFVGVTLQTLANRIRVAIVSVLFDPFHRDSPALPRRGIFHIRSGTMVACVFAGNTAIGLCGTSRARALTLAEGGACIAEAQGELGVAGMRFELGLPLAAVEFAAGGLWLERAKALACIGVGKYESVFGALGNGTIEPMVRVGPELESRLVHATGLKGFLVTGGATPINLLGVAYRVLHKECEELGRRLRLSVDNTQIFSSNALFVCLIVTTADCDIT
uniref:Putative major vault protein n=1 Tax=Trypanosoma congolense (strain IL3000) TaxID=1068625 RepID=G0UVI9_TRYCI|nr:putative major vault protein [Trypanosoma congolense IL3000]